MEDKLFKSKLDYELKNEKYFRKKINDKYLPEYNWVWSQQGTVNMHLPENWGYLIFSENNYHYTIPEEEITKQILYALFREVSFGNLKNLKKLNTDTFINFKLKDNNKKISCNFLKTDKGFVLSVKDGDMKFSIDETGKIKNKL